VPSVALQVLDTVLGGIQYPYYHPMRGLYFLQALAKSPSRMSCWALFHFA
jgi:hypothetical protein